MRRLGGGGLRGWNPWVGNLAGGEICPWQASRGCGIQPPSTIPSCLCGIISVSPERAGGGRTGVVFVGGHFAEGDYVWGDVGGEGLTVEAIPG